MAKKKTKNLLNILMDLLTLAFGALILGFLALPHWTEKALNVLSISKTGYQLIDFENDTTVAVVLLLITIFASLMMLFALLKLLKDLNVVKNALYGRIVSFCMLISALGLAGFVVANCITFPSYVNNLNSPINLGILTQWAPIILNACLGIGSLMTSALSLKK